MKLFSLIALICYIGCTNNSNQVTSNTDTTLVKDTTMKVPIYPAHITSVKELDELIATDKPVIIDFYAEWCGPCKVMEPYFQVIQEERANEIIAVKVDVDKFPELSERYKIDGIPRVIGFKNSKKVYDQTGGLNLIQLTDAVNLIIK